jgi:hypothetical protein
MAGPICDPYGRIIEFDQFITAAGTVYDLHAPVVRSIMSDSDTGLAPVELITERGAYQHGASLKDVLFKSRTVQMVLRQQAFSRTGMWFMRDDLVDAIKPNGTVGQFPGAGAPDLGRLRKWMPNGSHIDLEVLVMDGPGFSADNSAWDQYGFTETVRFYAPNPLYFNPIQQALDMPSPVNGFIFPITFPIVFSDLNITDTAIYRGNFEEYPNITIVGPVDTPVIYNHTTDEKIALNYNLQAGQTIEITLTPGNKSVALNDGTDLLSYVSDDSSLVTFHLEPAPEAPDGNNSIQATGIGVTTDTDVRLTWYERYVSLTILED